MISFNRLAETIEGELHTDTVRRHLLATDGSIFRQMPAAVAYPKTCEDVVRIVKFAGEHHLCLHPRGAGSGVCGGAVGPGIVIDFAKYMNGLIDLDIEAQSFECQPGFRMGQLSEHLAGTGLFFPPDPSSGEYATFGGMYNTNASGARSVKYGNVGDYCVDAEIVTGNGQVIVLSDILNCPPDRLPPHMKEIHDLYAANKQDIESSYPPVRHNSTGYNLRGLVTGDGHLDLHGMFAGAEGTLGIVTRMKFRLVEKNKYDILIVAYFNDIIASAKAAQKILPLAPCSIEIMDKSLLDLARQKDDKLDRLLPQGLDNLLLIAFDEKQEQTCREKAEATAAILKEPGSATDMHIAFSEHEKKEFWSIRKAAVPILYKMKGDKKVLALIEDATVPTDRLVPYFEGIYKILNKLDVRFVLFGHIAKGLLHTRPMLNLKDENDVELLSVISDRIFDLVHSLGGAISGEHGDGRLRSIYIRQMYPDIFHLFKSVKALCDPMNILNPDIITGGSPETDSPRASQGRFSRLRYGTGYRALNPYDSMLFPPDQMTLEIEKCHGCSKCTTVTHATRMCPVYKALRDEAAAPKAKANILRSLIDGSFTRMIADQNGDQDGNQPVDSTDTDRAAIERMAYAKALFHVLDHCINCGSCSHECPSEVDIPKMVMEARASFKKRYGISLTDHLLTSVPAGARIGRHFTPLLAPVLSNRALRQIMEKTTGISARRTLDLFARQPLAGQRFDQPAPTRGRVLYFAGCYAGHIKPEIGQAAVKVLNAAGFEVMIPKQECCGLPMVSKGMVKKARHAAVKNLAFWYDLLAGCDHIVTSCSSCLYALTRYWEWLLGRTGTGDVSRMPGAPEQVRHVAEKTVHMSHLVADILHGLDLKERRQSVAYHMPCHLKAMPQAQSSITLLKGLPGMDLDCLTSHCCGMAGTWGMLASNHDLSMRIGDDLKTKFENSRAKAGATDCPTCRMQMEAVSSKPVFHPMEIVAGYL